MLMAPAIVPAPVSGIQINNGGLGQEVSVEPQNGASIFLSWKTAYPAPIKLLSSFRSIQLFPYEGLSMEVFRETSKAGF
jgi:hypothetical protein